MSKFLLHFPACVGVDVYKRQPSDPFGPGLDPRAFKNGIPAITGTILVCTPGDVYKRQRLQDLVWGLTNQGDVAALQGYVRRFRSGPHAQEASRLIENALWTRLDKQNPGALRDFLSQYPNSSHREEAQSFLNKIDLQGADKKAIQTALDKFNAAFEHHQTRELKQIWPAVTEQYLNLPAGYKVVLMLQQTGDPAISGDTAVVPCQVNSKTTKPGGQTTENQKQTNLHLRKSGGGWLISSFGQ